MGANALDRLVETIHGNAHGDGADGIRIVAADVRVSHERLGSGGHDASDCPHAFSHIGHDDPDGGGTDDAPFGLRERRVGGR